MANKNTKKYSSNKKTSFYELSPEKIQDKDLPKNFMEIAKGKEFTAYEILSGIYFHLVVDDNITIHADEKSKEIVEAFNNEYVKPLSRLIQFFGEGINFTLYGTFISHEVSKTGYIGPPRIFFYDMFINSNWVRNDDFRELLPKFGLNIAPIIKEGVINNSFIRDVNNAIDSVSNINGVGEVYGIYFKSLNGIGHHRDIKKGAYTFFNEKYRGNAAGKSISLAKEKEAKKKIEEVAYFTVTNEIMDKWEIILKSRNIEKKKSNKNKIMPILMNSYIEEYDEEKELLALELEVSKEDAEKLMKKYVSKIILSKFFNRG